MGASDAKGAPAGDGKKDNSSSKPEPKSEPTLSLTSVSDKTPASATPSLIDRGPGNGGSSAADKGNGSSSATDRGTGNGGSTAANGADLEHAKAADVKTLAGNTDTLKASMALLADTSFLSSPLIKTDAVLKNPSPSIGNYPYPDLILASFVAPDAADHGATAGSASLIVRADAPVKVDAAGGNSEAKVVPVNDGDPLLAVRSKILPADGGESILADDGHPISTGAGPITITDRGSVTPKNGDPVVAPATKILPADGGESIVTDGSGSSGVSAPAQNDTIFSSPNQQTLAEQLTRPIVDRALDGLLRKDADPTDIFHSYEQRKAGRDIEDQMKAFLPYFVGKPGASGAMDQATAQNILETDNGKFGPQATELYKRYLDWLQKENAPTVLRQLQDRGLPMPPGGPRFTSDAGKAPYLPGRDLSAPDLRADFGIDPNKKPDAVTFMKLSNSLDWMIRSNKSMLEATQKVMDNSMIQDLKSLGFSEAFLPKPDTDMAKWRVDTAVSLDLARDMRRYGEAVKALRDEGYWSKLQLPLPPGVSEGPGGKLIYDLPKDPRTDTVSNQARLIDFAAWKASSGDKIDQTLMRVELAKLNANKMLQWGDIELRDQEAVFSKDGQFQSLAKAGTYKPKDGEKVESVNLLQNRFTTRTEKDDKGNDVIVVSQEVQANSVASWGYQNLIGVTPVGNAYKPAEQRYKPEDFVPISTSSGMKLIQARDLERYKFVQEVEHYGGKSLIGVMDAAMAVTAVVGVGEVIAGARVLVAGAEVAGNVMAKDLALQGAKMGLRLTVASAGVFNNAGANDTEWGRRINQARAAYFMADIAIGIGSPYVTPLARKVLGMDGTIDVGERGGALLSAPKVIEGAQQAKVPSQVTREGGVIKEVKTETGVPRVYSYAQDAGGNPAPNQIRVGTGADTITMSRTGEHEWTVQKGTAPATKLEGDISVNDDGSYTVKYLTDQRASWYAKAYEKGDPLHRIEREVTYKLDGTVSTKGMEGIDFTPAEGSVFTKTSRAGEYWTAPNGTQTWIDGQAHVWQRASEGIWTTKTAVLTENKDWVKATPIFPERITSPIEWTNKNGQVLKADKGWKMPETDGSGGFYVTSEETFAKTYTEVPGQPGAYIKSAITKARKLDRDTSIDSESGVYHGKKGDYLVTSKTGDAYIVPEAEFDAMYKAAPSGKTSEPFVLPTPTGAAKQLENGVVETPWASGKIFWDSKNATVTVTDTVKKTSETFELETKSGTFFSFSDGTKVRITPAGLRMLHEPGMPAGTFKAEDGGVFTDATHTTVPIIGDASPTKFSGTLSAAEAAQYPSREQLAVQPANGQPGRDAAGNKFIYDGSDTIRISGAGQTTLLDSRGRVWLKDGSGWTSEHGTYTKDAQGQHWSWKDGSQDWIDSESRVWSRTSEMEQGLWRSTDGATYREGSWRYTPRTKDDPLPDSIYRGAAFGEVAANQIKAQTQDNRTTSAQRMDAFIQSQMEKSAWLSAVTKGSELTFKATEKITVAQSSFDSFKQLERIFGPKNKDTLAEAWRLLPEGPGMRIAKAGDFDLTKADTLKPATDMLSQYEDTLSRGRSPEVAATVRSVFDRTKEVMRLEAAGDPTAAAEKAKLMEELVRTEHFNGQETWDLNNWIRNTDSEDGRMRGRPLSGKDLDALYAGKMPDWIDPLRGEKLLKMAEGIMSNRNHDAESARQIALLYLARDADGKIPNTVGQADTKIMAANRNSSGRYLPPDMGYVNKVSIDSTALIARLTKQLTENCSVQDTKIGADQSRGLVVGDVLTRLGAMSHAQYATILKDVLIHPNTSKEDKIMALVGGQSIDFATLTAEVRASENSSSGERAIGATANQLIAALESVASNRSEDADVRAIAGMMRYGLEPENIASLPNLVEAARNCVGPNGKMQPGAFSGPAFEYLKSRAVTSPPDTAIDDNELYARLNAAKVLKLLSNTSDPRAPEGLKISAQALATIAMQAKSPQLQAEALKRLSEKSLDDGEQVGDFRLNQDMFDINAIARDFNSHTRTMMDVLGDDHPELVKQTTDMLINKLADSFNSKSFAEATPDARQAAVDLLDSAMPLIGKMSDEQKQHLAEVSTIIYKTLRTSPDQISAYAKTTALSTVTALSGKPLPDPVIKLLKGAADSDPKSGESNPAVRQAAISILNQNDYEQMKDLVDRLGQTETDPAVRKTLTDLQFAYAQKAAREGEEKLDELAALSSKVQDTMLPGFDAAAQTKWLHDRFPMLSHADYEAAVKVAGDESMNWFSKLFSSESTIDKTGIEAMRRVSEERERQWNRLTQLAMRPDANDQNSIDESNRAKAILYSMVRAQGDLVASPNAGIIPWRQHVPKPLDQTDPLSNKTDDWQRKAADALVAAAQPGVVGRALIESYFKNIVAHPDKVPIDVRLQVLNSWVSSFSPIKQLTTNPAAGSSFTTMSSFYTTLRMAYDAEKAKQSKCGIL